MPTQTDSLLLESNLYPLSFYLDRDVAMAAEKFRRSPRHEPMCRMASMQNLHTYAKSVWGWQEASDDILTRAGLCAHAGRRGNLARAQENHTVVFNRDTRGLGPVFAPWDVHWMKKVRFHAHLPYAGKGTDRQTIARKYLHTTAALVK